MNILVATSFITSKKYIRISEQNEPTYVVHEFCTHFILLVNDKVINIGSLHIS